MKAARLAACVAVTAVAGGISTGAGTAESGASYASTVFCENWTWSASEGDSGVMLLPDGSPTGFTSKGECISAMQQGQSVLIVFGTVGDPTSGDYAYIGIVVDSAGTVHAFVLAAGPNAESCFNGYLVDTEGNVLAAATVSSPNEFVSVPLTGVYFQPAPGRAYNLGTTNIGSIGGGSGC